MLRLASISVLVALGACTQTGIDVIEGGAADAGTLEPEGSASGGTGGSGTAWEPPAGCAEGTAIVAPGLVRIRQRTSELCLARGRETLLEQSKGYEVEVVACSLDDAQLWQLNGVDPLSFQALNVATGYNLDIKFAESAEGTLAVLFEPHLLYNQRFQFVPLESGGFAIVPRHALGMCLTDRAASVQIWPCTSEDPWQRWQVFDEACF